MNWKIKISELKQFIKALFDKERLDVFLDKQGFYVVLLLCFAVIGITALYARGPSAPIQETPIESAEKSDNPDSSDDGVYANVVPEFVQKLSDITEQDSQAGINTLSDALNEVYFTTTPSPTSTPYKARLEPRLIWPLDGEAAKSFSGNNLVFSETLREYRTHQGLDISGRSGENIVAAFSGQVEKAYDDPLLGNVIILSHDNDVQTVYVGLHSLNFVNQTSGFGDITGKVVTQGEVIGTLGTIPSESEEGPHLHFEMIKEGVHVDPRLYLEKKK